MDSKPQPTGKITATVIDPTLCPVCHRPNDCAACKPDGCATACWCVTAEISTGLLALVPETLRNRACICRNCVDAFQRGQTPEPTGDFYFDADGLLVFTATYHLKRGHCCGNNCRHCPYVPDMA